MDRDKALRWAKACLARAEGSDNVHEAEIARKRAQDLVRAHGFTVEELAGPARMDIVESEIGGEMADVLRFTLLSVVAKSLDCKAIRQEVLEVRPAVGGTRVGRDGRPAVSASWHGKVVGKLDDASTAAYLFALYEREIERIVVESKAHLLPEPDERAFRKGVIYSLQLRVLNKVAEPPRRPDRARADARALMREGGGSSASRVDGYMDQKYWKRTTPASESTESSSPYFSEGIRAGRMHLQVIDRHAASQKIGSPAESPESAAGETKKAAKGGE
jgi:hypothetical protein